LPSRALAIPGLILGLFLAAEAAFRLHWFGVPAVLHPVEYGRASSFQRGFVRRDPDPAIGWTLRPGVSSHLRGARFTTNSAGYRSPEMPREKAPGRVRLIHLGASLTMGAAVADDETYPYRLEAWLHAHGRPDVEVLNAAVPNYTAPQSVAAYERDLRAFDADATLIPVYPGTLNAGRRQPTFATRDGWDVSVRRALSHLYLYSALRREARLALSPWLALAWDDRARPAPARPPNREAYSALARRRAAEGRTVYAALLAKARAYGPGRFAKAREEVAAWAAGHPNVVVIDALPQLDPSTLEAHQAYPGDSHPDPEHHRRSAAAVGRALLTHLPPATP
jgi:hypothetical protein